LSSGRIEVKEYVTQSVILGTARALTVAETVLAAQDALSHVAGNVLAELLGNIDLEVALQFLPDAIWDQYTRKHGVNNCQV
jgi:hypothetical protein